MSAVKHQEIATTSNYKKTSSCIQRIYLDTAFAKNLMSAKLQGQTSLLKSLNRVEVAEPIIGLAEYLTKVNSPTAKEKRDLLLTIESGAGHLYFRNCVKFFDPKYKFYPLLGEGWAEHVTIICQTSSARL